LFSRKGWQPNSVAVSLLVQLSVMAVVLLALANHCQAQLSPIQPPSQWNVPQGTGSCSIEKSCAELAPQMIQSALGTSPLEDNLRYLTDTIGGRVTGSPQAATAIDWAVSALRRAGASEVHTEKFTVPAGWAEGHTQAEIVSSPAFPVRLVSIGWSPPTPAGGITANIVDVGSGDEKGFANAGAAARSAIVLVHTKVLASWEDLAGEYEVDPGIIDNAKKAGTAAILWMSTRPNLLLYRHTIAQSGQIEPIPQAVVAREDAERIARFLAAGQSVRVHLDMPNHVTSPVESANVVGEIRGREKPNEFVLLGAHLDSWDLGTGALDNGCNDAMVIDAARVIHSSGSIPRRSIRFVLFTGEEQGMVGSKAYAKAHRAQLDHMVAAILFDAGTGPVTGYSVGVRGDAIPALREVLAPVKSLGVKDFTVDAAVDTDNFDFMLEGVLTLVANQDTANYLLNYHAASDTFDKVDLTALKRQVAIAAVSAYALADSETRIGKRLTRAELDQLIAEKGLDQVMKLEGIWPAWEKGERGRQP
jgi:carboxypeptidase Q